MYIFTKITYCLLLFIVTAFSKDFSFSGFGSTGYIFYKRNIIKGVNQESFYEGKFQVDIKINKHIDAQLDFRGNSFDQDVELREFSVKLKYHDYIKFKFGNLKLPFGYEQLINRENLPTVERSNSQKNFASQGFGGRSVGLQAYYKYSEKRADFPFSYFVNLYSNNSFQKGIVIRSVYHINQINIGANYQLFHHESREEFELNAQGYGFDLTYDNEKLNLTGSAYIFRNVDLSLAEMLYNLPIDRNLASGPRADENVNGASLQFSGGYKFNLDGEIVKYIEPLYLFSTYIPDMDQTASHELQNIVGVNVYFSKKVRLRIQGDFRFTKSAYAEKYATLGSRQFVELHVRF